LAALVGKLPYRIEIQPRAMAAAPLCRLYLITPPLGGADLAAFAPRFAEALGAGDVASALARVAPAARGEAKRILQPLVELATARDVAALVESDARLAQRVGADGAHVTGIGDELAEGLASLHPGRIVGAGGLRSRDDAMRAGEAGADYVMFGEPRRDGFAPPLAETLERVAWWAEIFETPCVAFAGALDAVAPLTTAGADFVALADAVWLASSAAAAVAEAQALIAKATV
jgi:thiamine-phosphate pyrophosphorylase